MPAIAQTSPRPWQKDIWKAWHSKSIMDNIKPYEKIAIQFQISQESAKYFLNHVQKSFKTERPSHKLILEFVESQNFEFLLTPYEIATLMNESGVWVYPLGTPPPVILDDEDTETD